MAVAAVCSAFATHVEISDTKPEKHIHNRKLRFFVQFNPLMLFLIFFFVSQKPLLQLPATSLDSFKVIMP